MKKTIKILNHISLLIRWVLEIVVFFAFCIIKVRCRVDIAMHARLLNTKYTLFTAFHTLIRERGL